MNKARLLKACDVVEKAVATEGAEFDLAKFGYADPTTPTGVACRTAACFIGFVVASGVFKDDGLTKSLRGSSKIEPRMGDKFGSRAIAELFDIPVNDACALFYNSNEYYGRKSIKGREGAANVIAAVRAYAETGRLA